MSYYGNEYYPGAMYYHYPHLSAGDPGVSWVGAYPVYDRKPQRNIHVNPAFYQTSVPTMSGSGKVLVNPKFFNLFSPTPNVTAENTISQHESPKVVEKIAPVPQAIPKKNMVVVNKKYSWKKVEACSKVSTLKNHQFIRSSGQGCNFVSETSAKLKRHSSTKPIIKSRYKVDKRGAIKPKVIFSRLKVVNSKYKIVRTAHKSTVQPSHKIRTPSKGKFSSPCSFSPKVMNSPGKFKLFRRNKWRPLSSLTSKPGRIVPLPEKKTKIKTKKKQENLGPAKRYYNSTDVEKTDEASEEVEFEVADQHPGLRQREPLGELPSFITLS